MQTIIIIFIAAFLIRIVSLFKSIANEKRLKQQNAAEYGKTNSILLSAAHILFYFSSLGEAVLRQRTINSFTYWGIALFIFSMVMLWLVIAGLKDVWTVKLYISPTHTLNSSPLFRFVKHPNYFLNILPELCAIALICQSWLVLVIGLPLYLIPLTIRIVQEERIMKQTFAAY